LGLSSRTIDGNKYERSRKELFDFWNIAMRLKNSVNLLRFSTVSEIWSVDSGNHGFVEDVMMHGRQLTSCRATAMLLKSIQKQFIEIKIISTS